MGKIGRNERAAEGPQVGPGAADLMGMLQLERDAPMADTPALFSALSSALWLQREALQVMLYRLICKQLLLKAGAGRWQVAADDDVRAAFERLQDGEVLRAAEADELAHTLGLDADASLSELVERAPEPWHTVLADHRDAIRLLVYEIQGVCEANERLIAVAGLPVAGCPEVHQHTLVDFLR